MSSGVVNFRASIVSETLSVPSLGRAIESVDPGPSGEMYIEMGMFSEKHFLRPGDTSFPVMFEMPFENQDAQHVRVTFSGITSDAINGVLGTTSPTVGVELCDENGTILKINESYDYPLYPGRNVLRFLARLIATRTPVLAGHIGAVAIFTLSYR